MEPVISRHRARAERLTQASGSGAPPKHSVASFAPHPSSRSPPTLTAVSRGALSPGPRKFAASQELGWGSRRGGTGILLFCLFVFSWISSKDFGGTICRENISFAQWRRGPGPNAHSEIDLLNKLNRGWGC